MESSTPPLAMRSPHDLRQPTWPKLVRQIHCAKRRTRGSGVWDKTGIRIYASGGRWTRGYWDEESRTGKESAPFLQFTS